MHTARFSITNSTDMDALKEAVDELYELRDKYFMKHSE